MGIKSLFIGFLLISLSIICIDDPCSLKTNIKSLQDCKNTPTTYYDSICCLRTINYRDGDDLSCYPVNRANGTLTVSFFQNGINGVLSCDVSRLYVMLFPLVFLIIAILI